MSSILQNLCKFFACKSDCQSECKSKCFAGSKNLLFKIFSNGKLNERTERTEREEDEPSGKKYPRMPSFTNLN